MPIRTHSIPAKKGPGTITDFFIRTRPDAKTYNREINQVFEFADTRGYFYCKIRDFRKHVNGTSFIHIRAIHRD